MKKNLLMVLCSGLLIAGCASADSILAPGAQSQTPDNLTSSIAGLTYVTSISGTFNSASWNGTYTAAVYSGATADTGCSTANCLTFLYQVTNTSNANGLVGTIANLSASSFSSFATEVGYATSAPTTNTPGFSAGTINPTTIDRTASPGSVVEWDFNSPAFNIGSTSDILVIETNATAFVPGLVSGLGAATVTQTAYGVTSLSAAPEPTSMVLFGSALVGLGLLRKRARR